MLANCSGIVGGIKRNGVANKIRINGRIKTELVGGIQRNMHRALSSSWSQDKVWIHGDIAVNNLLLKDGELIAVIDFGQLAIGDPACDLALYWTLFAEESRRVFKQIVMLDENTWDRARGWVLWKTLCAPIQGTDCQSIIQAILDESCI